MMSDMMAPLTNIEELDKRITDMRAVEQWLKLNLNMLQSAIQALEVQRATLATLRAFGALRSRRWRSRLRRPPRRVPRRRGLAASGGAGAGAHAPKRRVARSAASQADNEASAENGEEEAPATPPFDASAWWNLLQSQFNQIAQFAMTQPAVAAAAAGGRAATDAPQDAARTAAGEQFSGWRLACVGRRREGRRQATGCEAGAGGRKARGRHERERDQARKSRLNGSERNAERKAGSKHAPDAARH